MSKVGLIGNSMKRLLVTMIALTSLMMAEAKEPVDMNLFNHLAVGVDAGTAGFGADLAFPVTRFLQFQVGFAAMPKFTGNGNLDLNADQYRSVLGTKTYLPAEKVAVEGKLNLMNAKVLVNFYPVPVSGFHLTVGAFFGDGDVLKVYNKEPGALMYINEANQEIEKANMMASPDKQQDYIGLELGDYLLTPDENGDVKAKFKTKSTRLYVGLGTGRAVPKRRVNVKFDVGCLLWGTPEITCNDIKLQKGDWDGEGAKVLRILSKLSVYPCINLRLSGRIF